MFVKRIIRDYSEELNSTVNERMICKIKFHGGVEFNFAIELIKIYLKNIKKVVDK